MDLLSTLESATRFHSWMQFAATVFGVFTAVASVLIFWSGNRMATLQGERDRAAQERLAAAESATVELKSELGEAVDKQQKAEEALRQLNESAKAASRGVVKRFDFNGVRRTQSGGHFLAEAGEETQVFRRLATLEESKQYTDLLRLCEEQIAKTPEWLTPYLFLGVAYANTGRREDAISKLEYVVSEAGGDPEYAVADRLLAELRPAP